MHALNKQTHSCGIPVAGTRGDFTVGARWAHLSFPLHRLVWPTSLFALLVLSFDDVFGSFVVTFILSC